MPPSPPAAAPTAARVPTYFLRLATECVPCAVRMALEKLPVKVAPSSIYNGLRKGILTYRFSFY